MKTVLSIQSWVSYGHVGNAAAMLPLQRLGIDVWAIHTVQFSNHTGYGDWRGPVFTGAMVSDIVLGIEERGQLQRCDGVLSGYMGDREIGGAIVDAVARVKRANPRAKYCCDPVIGDVGHGVYVAPGIAELLRTEAVPRADIVTPKLFELEMLSGIQVHALEDALAGADVLHRMGPQIVLVTSLVHGQTPADHVDLLVSTHSGSWLVRTPRLPIEVSGAGDVIAALFFAHVVRTGSAEEALIRSASSIFGLLRHTAAAGGGEIRLVQAQEEFVSPTWTATIERVR